MGESRLGQLLKNEISFLSNLTEKAAIDIRVAKKIEDKEMEKKAIESLTRFERLISAYTEELANIPKE